MIKNRIPYLIFVFVLFLGLQRIIGELFDFPVLIKMGRLLNISPAPRPFITAGLNYKYYLSCEERGGAVHAAEVNHHLFYNLIKSEALIKPLQNRMWQPRRRMKKYLNNQFCKKRESLLRQISGCIGEVVTVEYESIYTKDERRSIKVQCPGRS